MCGRFALNRSIQQIRALMGLRGGGSSTQGQQEFNPSYNIAPGNRAPVVANSDVVVLKFGSKINEATVINARSETAIQKFRDLQTKRCAIPADGYFEWDKTKQPFFFHIGKELIFFAGFYNKDGEFIILTREAAPNIRGVHERMPIILNPKQISLWESPQWAEILKSQPPILEYYPVSRTALRVGVNNPQCIERFKQKQLSMADFFSGQKRAKKEEGKTVNSGLFLK